MANMQCPACQDMLKSSERQGIEIDVCPRCRGVWLDRGELDKLLQREATPPHRSKDRRDDDDDDDRYPRRRRPFWAELFD